MWAVPISIFHNIKILVLLWSLKNEVMYSGQLSSVVSSLPYNYLYGLGMLIFLFNFIIGDRLYHCCLVKGKEFNFMKSILVYWLFFWGLFCL